MSSNGFGGGATGAWPRVQVCATTGAESGTVLTTQQQVGRNGERELFANDGTDIDTRRPGRQGVELGVVGGLGVARKDRSADFDVHLLEHLGQASAALAAHNPVHGAAPEVLIPARSLKLTGNGNAANQSKPESVEGRIVGTELSIRPHGTPLKVPNIHSQHSPLK